MQDMHEAWQCSHHVIDINTHFNMQAKAVTDMYSRIPSHYYFRGGKMSQQRGEGGTVGMKEREEKERRNTGPSMIKQCGLCTCCYTAPSSATITGNTQRY